MSTGGVTTLKPQFDYFYRYEKTASGPTAARFENSRLIEENVALKRKCQQLQAENFDLKDAEKLSGSIFKLGVGSAFTAAEKDVFSGWLSSQPADAASTEEPAAHDEVEKLIAELDVYLAKG